MAKKITERPLGNGKRLTLSEKILIRAEVESGKSKYAVAHEYGVAESTVGRICNNLELGQRKREVQAVKESFSDNLYLVASNCTDQIHAALPFASSKDAAIAMGICIEKARLIDNESTANINNAHAFLDSCNDVPV